MSAVAAATLAGCIDEAAPSTEPAAPNQLRDDGKADGGAPLWAGLTSVTIERSADDPCNHGARALGDDPITYDDWARQRAGVRNICFEVWSPGVTDVDNPDFWRLLDVQVHYRLAGGAWQTDYVASNGRRYNNRRYQWSLDFALDPIANAHSLVGVGAPLEILSEGNGWARVARELEVYFTVNGRVLNSPANRAFVVRYEGQARTPSLAPQAGGYVLGDIVTCGAGALRVGWGAGFFAVDVRDASAVAALGAGLDGSLIYGAPVARSGDLLSTVFSSQTTDAGQTLPSYRDAGGARVTPTGSSMRVELDVYDRAAGTIRTLGTTFTGCERVAN
ncbi:MAG: hypothetical protein KF773_17285 [Deltaproteobacteria bacterium]|nr:hypothetical protein [Deltaproteobacteria bacterium]